MTKSNSELVPINIGPIIGFQYSPHLNWVNENYWNKTLHPAGTYNELYIYLFIGLEEDFTDPVSIE